LLIYYKYIFIIFLFQTYFINSYSQDKTLNKIFEIDEIDISFNTLESHFEKSDIELLLASKSGDNFDIETYLQDVERIKKYYFDNGFFDAVVDTGIVYNTADEEVIEKFKIIENARYSYYEINYNGLDSIDNLLKGLIIKPEDKIIVKGRYYSKDSIKLELNRVMNLLFNHGYATANSANPEILKYESSVERLKNKININFTFHPELKYTFGKTDVKFIDKKYNVTREDILREITYKENEIYDKSEVVNSELNLSKISLIENPRINIDKIDSNNKKIDFIIKALIRNKYDVTPEIFGYYFQQLFYVGAGISFSDKNFFGGGRVLTSSLRYYFHSFKDYRLEYINSIFQPFLFNNRNISGNWDIGAEVRLFESGNITQIKNAFGISYTLPNYTYINKLSAKWEVENTHAIIYNLFVDADFDYNYFTSALTFTALHNSTNDLKFPYSGYYQSYSIEDGGLLGGLVRKIFNTNTLSYVKFSNFNSKYFNLSNQRTNVPSALALKFSTGVIFEYGVNSFFINGVEVQTDRVPNDKKFVCGGSSSIRGWAANQLGIVADKSIGGDFIIESSVEQRLRPFLNVSNVYLRDLGFAAFVDFGNAWSEIGKFKFNEIALAAGGGIRYYTIIGAIRFDMGFKIYDPQPGNVGGSNWIFGKGSNFIDKYNFQFGIGNTF